MYDELVKQLREPCQYENCVLCQQAADAIEELQKAVNFHKPITNADRIRAMSVEELAEAFANACPEGKTVNRCCTYFAKGGRGCHDCWLDWLKEEAVSDG